MGLGCDQVVSAGRDRILYFVVHMGRPVSHCLLRVFLRIRWEWGITNKFGNEKGTCFLVGKAEWGLHSPNKEGRSGWAFSRQERGAALKAGVKWDSDTISERQELSSSPSWAMHSLHSTMCLHYLCLFTCQPVCIFCSQAPSLSSIVSAFLACITIVGLAPYAF